MTPGQKRVMRAYIKQHGGAVEIGKKCDVCWAEVPGRMSLRVYLEGHHAKRYSIHVPNLCPDHGRELGVVW